VEIIHAIVNRHELVSRTFEAEAEGFTSVYCIQTDQDSAEVLKHIHGTDAYPSVTRTPAVLVSVPEYQVPDHTVTYIDDEDGLEKTDIIEGGTVGAHYEFISGVSSYSDFLTKKQTFEDNIASSNAGTYIPNINEST
jgi:hypothetical protein